MTQPTIPPMIGMLSHDIIIVCDEQTVVGEVNHVALGLLGSDIVGKPFASLLSERSYDKGDAFLDYITGLEIGDTTETWELSFQTIHSRSMPISIRSGRIEDNTWLLVGTIESPQLTAIYQEVLAINSELTNLIRQLSKEQAKLTDQLTRLLQAQE